MFRDRDDVWEGGANKNEGKFKRELKKKEVGVVVVGGVFWM